MRSARMLKEISPCGLIQEHLKDDTWRVLVACMLMNMTTGLTMRPYMWKLFEKWPDAHALAAADIDEVRELVKPLGLYNKRAKNLVEMSKAFVKGGWKTPNDLPGCGKYATDSWLIFCTDSEVDISTLKDKELKRFVHWLETGEYIPQNRGE